MAQHPPRPTWPALSPDCAEFEDKPKEKKPEVKLVKIRGEGGKVA